MAEWLSIVVGISEVVKWCVGKMAKWKMWNQPYFWRVDHPHVMFEWKKKLKLLLLIRRKE